MPIDAGDIHPRFYGAFRSTEFRKLRKRIVRLPSEVVDQYGMLDSAGPRALAGVPFGRK